MCFLKPKLLKEFQKCCWRGILKIVKCMILFMALMKGFIRCPDQDVNEQNS